ncbi:fructosamine kinase family protein [Sporolactobacillus sp. THM7-4]|nr:fructosamine kinase family protein [Sporolactobacillus sp. THM7-4]
MPSNNWLHKLPIQPVDRAFPVSGGDINKTFALESRGRRYFLKVHKHVPGNFFTGEMTGLKRLREAVRTPRVIASGQISDKDFLILEWIPAAGSRNDQMLGQAVARVHKITSPAFGFDEDNYAGQLPQYNHWEKDWATFYLKWRLFPQIEIAKKRGYWNMYRQRKFEKLAAAIQKTCQKSQVIPSLLHGDLWSGNVLFSEGGEPVLIDPAVFYGNREMDIAMTRLFGGFGTDFYQTYNDVFPLDPGWEERISWYQLYYLLCHLNMFGEGYGASVDRALES